MKDSPVDPAGVIFLRCFNTSCRFFATDSLASERILFFVFGSERLGKAGSVIKITLISPRSFKYTPRVSRNGNARKSRISGGRSWGTISSPSFQGDLEKVSYIGKEP